MMARRSLSPVWARKLAGPVAQRAAAAAPVDWRNERREEPLSCAMA